MNEADYAKLLAKIHHVEYENLKEIDDDGFRIKFTYEDYSSIEFPSHIANRRIID